MISIVLRTSIRYLYIALFFITPLVFTKVNYELFEFNKMLIVYAVSIFVATLWIVRMILEKRFIFKSTILDIPIMLFLIAHLISTITSIDPYISTWGYYGRFNGGLVSVLSYILLYYGFVSNVTEEPIVKRKQNTIWLMVASLCSGILVSSYAIAQRFGIDANIWVQDVQNRVFSTFGQPNWLAAYLAITLLFSLSLGYIYFLSFKQSGQKKILKNKSFLYSLLFTASIVIFYITLLFTKSRSGFISFWVCLVIFWIGVFVLHKQIKLKSKALLQYAVSTTIALVALTILLGSPFQIFNQALPKETTVVQEQEARETNQQEDNQPIQAINVTDSGDIRRLVWKGALDAAIEKPFFGWGVETFAWIYYRSKPLDHNLTSEWDFLYNKAHNEYLNYAATTGFVGLGSYLLIIGVFIWWFIKNALYKIKKSELLSYEHKVMAIGLFTAWLSLLVTNFFGFSVVVTSIYFWMIPAIVFVLFSKDNPYDPKQDKSITPFQWVGLVITIGAGIFLIFSVSQYWWADYFYAQARSNVRSGYNRTAVQNTYRALTLRPYDAVYHNNLTNPLAHLAVSAYEIEINNPEEIELESATHEDLIDQAIQASDTALKLSPNNVTFWKGRTRMFYTLSQIDENYTKNALESVLTAQSLAPNDPKIVYNVGIVYELTGKTDRAIESFKKALDLKPDYKDAAWAIAIFYEQEKNQEESEKWLRYILENIDPNDQEVIKKLGE